MNHPIVPDSASHRKIPGNPKRAAPSPDEESTLVRLGRGYGADAERPPSLAGAVEKLANPRKGIADRIRGSVCYPPPRWLGGMGRAGSGEVTGCGHWGGNGEEGMNHP